ncbi:60S ribosomal protein L31 [Candidatus Woesearchaeota archaeon]|nr:60S ribosomal protein L31 [Candidatus Woesearchaeota archaeon]
MAIERTYNVPLRREFLKVPRYKRAKTAINALKTFLIRHMKSEEVYIGKRLHEKIWERGIKNPPHHVKVDVVKEDDGKVFAELSGFKYEKPVEAAEPKKKGKETMMEKLKAAAGGKEEPKAEEKKEVKPAEKPKAEAKPEVKKEEKKPDKKIEKAFEKLEKKTEQIKKEQAKKGEEKEKKLEHLEKRKEDIEKEKTPALRLQRPDAPQEQKKGKPRPAS